MTTISLEELGVECEAVVVRAEAGEIFLIMRDGVPVAKLEPASSSGRDDA